MTGCVPILAYVLMSVAKPILFGLVLTGWAWLAGWLDKDLARHFLPRRSINAAHVAAAVLAFGIWLRIPSFWVGLLLALCVLLGAFFGYVAYRNTQVSEEARWRFSLDFLRQHIEQVQASQATRRATVSLLGPDGSQLEVPAPSDPRHAGHEALQNLMDFALPRVGDRIDLAADADRFVAVVHVDGVSFPQHNGDTRLGVSLMEYLKEHAGLDVADRRRRQSGRLIIDAADYGRHTLDLAFAGSTRGLGMTIHIDRQKRTLLGLEQLGLLDRQKQQLQVALDQAQGTVIVACPVHMGLTTSIYSLVNTHDPYTQSIVTLEEQVAFELEGVNHEMIPSGTDPAVVCERLAVILRGDPQVVMLSRLANAQVARQVAEASGQMRFYVGLRQPDTFTVLQVWLKAVGDLKRGSQTLAAIVSQRLVRKLCPVCRVAYEPDAEALRKLNLPPERVSQLYMQTGQVLVRDKPKPCDACHGMGYRGRVGIFEIMVLDDEARELIAAGQLDQLRALLRRHNMLWLQEAALYKAVEGVTSIKEITRALGKDQKSQG